MSTSRRRMDTSLRSEEHTSELQSLRHLVCRLLLEKKHAKYRHITYPFFSDAATQYRADAYGPVATPHVFIFDKDRKLRYECFFFNNPAPTKIYTLSPRDALPI